MVISEGYSFLSRSCTSLGDHSCSRASRTYRRRRSSWARRLLPRRRDEARTVAFLPAEKARYSLRALRPPPLLTSRQMVDGWRFKVRAISTCGVPAASPRLISSRSRFVRRRYCFRCCIRIYCTHIRCVKYLTPSRRKNPARANQEKRRKLFCWVASGSERRRAGFLSSVQSRFAQSV